HSGRPDDARAHHGLSRHRRDGDVRGKRANRTLALRFAQTSGRAHAGARPGRGRGGGVASRVASPTRDQRRRSRRAWLKWDIAPSLASPHIEVIKNDSYHMTYEATKACAEAR